jgi:hypothetical protein
MRLTPLAVAALVIAKACTPRAPSDPAVPSRPSISAPPASASPIVPASDAGMSATKPPADASAIEPSLRASSDVPAAPKIRALHFPKPKTCRADDLLKLIGQGCHAITPTAVRASGQPQATTAVDRDTCTHWNSDAPPPQLIAIELPEGEALAAVLLVPEMTPGKGVVTHVLETSQDGDAFDARFIVRAQMESESVYAVLWPKAESTRHLRVRTVESPSWVAWREIVALACPRPLAPPAARLAPAPPGTQE